MYVLNKAIQIFPPKCKQKQQTKKLQEKHFMSKFLILDTFEIFNPMFHFRSYEVSLGEFKASESRPPQPTTSWSDTQAQIFKNQDLIGISFEINQIGYITHSLNDRKNDTCITRRTYTTYYKIFSSSEQMPWKKNYLIQSKS